MKDYIYLLKRLSPKYQRDLNAIRLWEHEGNHQNLEKRCTAFVVLASRQEKIVPFLRLRLLNKNKNAKFSFSNYNNEIISSKQKLSSYLYDNSKALLLTKNKSNGRAFDDLDYLKRTNPVYKIAI
ncbi:MAG: hypothetical protein ACI87N_001582 [Flavobacteriales bacterium]